MVGVEVRVHEVGHCGWGTRLGGDLLDRPQQVVTDGGRYVHDNHAVRGGKEHRLVEAARHPGISVGPKMAAAAGADAMSAARPRKPRRLGCTADCAMSVMGCSCPPARCGLAQCPAWFRGCGD